MRRMRTTSAIAYAMRPCRNWRRSKCVSLAPIVLLIMLAGTAEASAQNRIVRVTSREEAQPMDRALPANHSGNEYDGILLSVSWYYASHCRWSYFAGGSCCGCLRALRSSPLSLPALDLRCHLNASSLFECLRPDCAAFPESARIEGIGTDAVGAALCSYATRCSGSLRNIDDPSCNKIPRRTRSSVRPVAPDQG